MDEPEIYTPDREEYEMTNTVAIYIGSVLLALGVGSPALGSVNNHGAELVFFGLALLVSALYSDHCKDRSAQR